MADVFEIISYGNADMMETVLNGLAMITNSSGSYDLMGLAKVGFLFGLIFVVASATVTQKLEPQKLLVGLVFLYVMIVPKATVSIYDVYSGESRTVSGVPVGVGAPMYMVTRLGRWFTDAFEENYSIPDAKLQDGYMSALQILLKSRNLNIDYPGYPQTVRNYFKDCVNYMVNDDVNYDDHTRPTLASIRASGDLFGAIATDYVNRDTVEFLDSDGGKQLSCADAYDLLTSYKPLIMSYFNKVGFAQLGAIINDGNGGDVNEAVDRARNALGLLQTSQKNAQDYILNQVMENFYTGRAASLTESDILTTAGEQRRVQMAAEQSTFRQIARPLMAYVEILVPAVLPFAILLAGFGPVGVPFYTQYFKLIVWVALWQPFLALANMYIHIACAQDIAKLTQPLSEMASISGMNSVWTSIQDWYAVGGMLSAASPAIAGMLVWGVSASVGGIASRLNGGNADVSAAAPKVSETGALSTVGSMMAGTSRWSDPANGLQNQTGTTDVSATRSYASGSEASEVSRASESLNKAKSKEASAMISVSDSVADSSYSAFTKSAGRSEGANKIQSSDATMAQVDALDHSFIMSAGQKSAMQEAITTVAAIGSQNGWSSQQTQAQQARAVSTLAAKMGLSLKAEATGGSQQSTDEAIKQAMGAKATTSDSMKADASSGIKFDSSNSVGRDHRQSHVATALNSWKAARSESEQQSKNYDLAQKQASSSSSAAKFSAVDIGRLTGNDSRLAGKFDDLYDQVKDSGLYSDAVKALHGMGYTGGGRATEFRNAAVAQALIKGGGNWTQKLDDAMMQSGYAPTQSVNTGFSSDSNKGISGNDVGIRGQEGKIPSVPGSNDQNSDHPDPHTPVNTPASGGSHNPGSKPTGNHPVTSVVPRDHSPRGGSGGSGIGGGGHPRGNDLKTPVVPKQDPEAVRQVQEAYKDNKFAVDATGDQYKDNLYTGKARDSVLNSRLDPNIRKAGEKMQDHNNNGQAAFDAISHATKQAFSNSDGSLSKGAIAGATAMMVASLAGNEFGRQLAISAGKNAPAVIKSAQALASSAGKKIAGSSFAAFLKTTGAKKLFGAAAKKLAISSAERAGVAALAGPGAPVTETIATALSVASAASLAMDAYDAYQVWEKSGRPDDVSTVMPKKK